MIFAQRYRIRTFPQIILCLGIPKFLIQSFLLHQFLMAASLRRLPSVKHQNILAETAGGQPMGNVHGCLLPHHPVNPCKYLILPHRIQRRRELIRIAKGASLYNALANNNF